jgi:uncharacterized SAM-binding protein YcdF (DUF218 family)
MRGDLRNSRFRPPSLVMLKRIVLTSLAALSTLVIVLSLPVTADGLMSSLQIFPAIGESGLNDGSNAGHGAIVVLAAGRRRYAPEFGGQTVDSLSLERVRYGAYLAKVTRLPVLVAGGAANRSDIPLSRLLADALDRDYAVEAQWLETRSTNTAENAIFSAPILKRAGVDHILLVTHAWHMKRAHAAFTANGFAVTPAPTGFYHVRRDQIVFLLTPTVATFRMSGYAVHEILGNLWYAVWYGY